MEYSYPFKDIFGALKPSYRSIDLRAVLVALGDGQGWRSVLAILRFSTKGPEEVSQAHEALGQSYHLPTEFLRRSLSPSVNMYPYRGMNIELSSYDIDAFDCLVSRLNEGILSCRDRAFRLWDQGLGIDLAAEKASWRSDGYATDHDQWPVYYCGRGQQDTSLAGSPDASGVRPNVQERDLSDWARQAGLSNFRETCDRLLQASFGQGAKFEIRAPIYARIDGVHHSEKGLRVHGSFHTSLGGLSLECSVNRRDNRHQMATPQTLGRIQVQPQAQDGQLSPLSQDFVTDSPPVAGIATAVLFMGGPPRFDLAENSTDLRSGVPYFNAFTAFVPEADLGEYLAGLVSGQGIAQCQLFRRFHPKDSSKKADELLEYATNYILGLCQLNPILLSNPQYDSLTGGLSAGSADILAMTPKKDPLLVSCTMAMPDDRKLGMLTAARTAVCHRFGWPESQVKLLLVTGKPSVPQTNISSFASGINRSNEVRTLAAQDLENIWRSVRQGDTLGAWSLIGVDSHIL